MARRLQTLHRAHDRRLMHTDGSADGRAPREGAPAFGLVEMVGQLQGDGGIDRHQTLVVVDSVQEGKDARGELFGAHDAAPHRNSLRWVIVRPMMALASPITSTTSAPSSWVSERTLSSK